MELPAFVLFKPAESRANLAARRWFLCAIYACIPPNSSFQHRRIGFQNPLSAAHLQSAVFISLGFEIIEAVVSVLEFLGSAQRNSDELFKLQLSGVCSNSVPTFAAHSSVKIISSSIFLSFFENRIFLMISFFGKFLGLIIITWNDANSRL